MNDAIKIRGLCKSFGDFALQDVCLSVPGGSIMGLIGENGAGKTTTIKCILGMLAPDSGTIQVLGLDNAAHSRQIMAQTGVVLDECAFHDGLRPRDIDAVLSRVYQDWDSALFRDYLEKFKLPERKYVKAFSRGMKMKLSLAAALAHRPRLLILDEATAGLDPVVRDEILDEFLAFISDEDHSVLISSHITSDLEKAADYITYLHQGRVVLSDTKDAILDSYGRVACTAAQLETIAPGDLLRVQRGSFGCQGLVADLAAFAKKYPGLLVERTSLEDIMLFMGRGEGK